MINEINHRLRIYIPRLDQLTDRDNQFVGIVKCIRDITRIGLKDAKNIVDADDKWHNVPIFKDSLRDVDKEHMFIDKLYELGCQAWIEEETPTVEQDYMDTLGSLMEGATPKEEKEADTIVDLKHYILMAINLKQYKMAKYLIDNLAQYEET